MIEHIMEEPNFWEDPDKAQGYVKELKNLKDIVDEYNNLKGEYEDIETLIEMGYEANDESLLPEIEEMLDKFTVDLDELRLSTLLSEEYDKYNGQIKKDIPHRFLTFWMVKKQD